MTNGTTVNQKSVLIFVPTTGLLPDPNQWMKSFLSVINNVIREKLNYAVFTPYRLMWWESNNQAWDIAFNYKFDYILRMDDDVWGIPDGAFSKLLSHDKDVVGACYPLRTFPYSYAAFRRTDTTKSIVQTWNEGSLDLGEVVEDGLQKVDLVGFGMTLIKTERFRRLPRPIFQYLDDKGDVHKCPDDSYFAQLCLDNNIEQYVDFDVKLCHREITPINKVYLFNCDARALIQSGVIKGGNTFHDNLIELFGNDGQKDAMTIKGGELKNIVMEKVN